MRHYGIVSAILPAWGEGRNGMEGTWVPGHRCDFLSLWAGDG